MNRTIVTVRRADSATAYDLDLPADLPVEQLTKLLARSLNWHIDAHGRPLHYLLEAYPPGRPLQLLETLASAGVWDGAWLIVRQVEQPMATFESARSGGPQESPVGGWRPIAGFNQPTTDSSGQRRGYSWKRIDEE